MQSTLPSTLPIDVYFVVSDGSLALDLAGPSEVLRVANDVLQKRGKPECFRMHTIGCKPTATLSTGFMLAEITPLPKPKELPDTAWVVVLGQAQNLANEQSNHRLRTWLSKLPLANTAGKAQCLQLMSVCTGSIMLAQAGLLKNVKATTHHSSIDVLQQVEPNCHVQTDSIFVEDGNICSSAGVTTGIDMMVHKVAQHCGEIIAAEVAQRLVMPVRRSAKDPQYSSLVSRRNHLHQGLQQVQQAVGESPQHDWSVAEMAKIAHTSARHLTRLFMQHAQIAPMTYVKQVRLHLAQSALKSGFNVSQAAEIAGFHSDTQLRRAWHSLGLPETPSSYAKSEMN